MSFVYFNPNPIGKRTSDCVIRALSKFFNVSWMEAYINICIYGAENYDMPNVNSVWSSYLESKGYVRHKVKDTCPYCYTLNDFCYDHPYGKYFVSLDVGYADIYSTADSGFIDGNHVVCVIDGDYYDTWKSGNEVVIFYWS